MAGEPSMQVREPAHRQVDRARVDVRPVEAARTQVVVHVPDVGAVRLGDGRQPGRTEPVQAHARQPPVGDPLLEPGPVAPQPLDDDARPVGAAQLDPVHALAEHRRGHDPHRIPAAVGEAAQRAGEEVEVARPDGRRAHDSPRAGAGAPRCSGTPTTPPVGELEAGVAVRQGRRPVRDEEARAPLHQPLHRLEDPGLGRHVDRARGLVEHQDAAALEEGPGQRDPLPLATRQPHPALTDRGVVAVRETADEPVRVRLVGGGDDLAHAGVRPGVADVLRDARGEQRRLLESDGHLAPEVREPVVPQVGAVQQDPAGRGVVEPDQQADQGRLARAGDPPDAQVHAGLDPDRHVAQDGRPAVVRHRDPVELHQPGGPRQPPRRRSAGVRRPARRGTRRPARRWPARSGRTRPCG